MPNRLSFKLELEPAAAVQTELKVLSRDELVRALGGFGFDELHRAELTGVAAKLLQHEELTTAEMRHLISAVPLGQLAKLASLCTPCQSAGVAVRPTLLIPAASALEEGGKKFAVQTANAALRRAAESVELSHTIHIALDRWTGQFELSDLLDVLDELKSSAPVAHRAIGPSSAEIRELLRGPQLDHPAPISLRELFKMLERAGIDNIEGGTDFEIHLSAVRAGLSAAVQQTVHEDLQTEPAEQIPLFPLAADQRYSFNSFVKVERFLSDLLFIRSQLAATKRMKSWAPHHSVRLPNAAFTGPSSTALRQTSALHALRCVALARIFLPDVAFIRAPLSIIGSDLLELAVMCGANDIGCAALDAATADLMGIIKLSRLKNLVGGAVQFRHLQVL